MKMNRLMPAFFLAALTSCSTLVNVSYLKPARIALGGADSTAVFIKHGPAVEAPAKARSGDAIGLDFNALMNSLLTNNKADLVPEAERMIAALFLSELSASGKYRASGPFDFAEIEKWYGKADSLVAIEVLEANAVDVKSLDYAAEKDGTITEFEVFDRLVHLKYRYEALDAKGGSLGSSTLEGNLTSTTIREREKLERPESLLEQIIRQGKMSVRKDLVPSKEVWAVSLLPSSDPRMKEAEGLAGKGKLIQAAELYKSLSEAGGGQEALFNLGLIQFSLGDRAAGIEVLRVLAEGGSIKDIEMTLKRMEEIASGEAALAGRGSAK
jgi:hypothetical protein